MDLEIKDSFDEDLVDSAFSDLSEEESIGICDIKLKDFDGPFDTLCHLIRKSKYSIEDVKISDITMQYMQYMTQLDQLDLEKATEFIAMASWLLEIKSRTLLPKPQIEEEDIGDPEKILKQQLAEYALYKEASTKLKEYETVDMLYRLPDDSVGKPRFTLNEMNTEGLLTALQRIFLKLEQRAIEIKERHIVKDSFTVEEKIAYIKDKLLTDSKVYFSDLFLGEFNKNEIITTFQALLELLKAQYLVCHQNEIYGDILLKKIEAETKQEIDFDN